MIALALASWISIANVPPKVLQLEREAAFLARLEEEADD